MYVISSSANPDVAFGENTETHVSYSTNMSVSGDPLSFTDSAYVHIRARDYSDRLSDEILTYGPFKPQDPTAPSTPVMAASIKTGDPGFYLLRPSVDLETNISKYQLGAGTSLFSRDILDWTEVDMSSVNFVRFLWQIAVHNGQDWPDDQAATFVDIPTEDLSTGDDLYLQLRALNDDDIHSSISYSGPIIYDTTPPKNPSISLNNHSYNSQLSISVSDIEDPESGISKVEYKVVDTETYLASNRLVKDWSEFMIVNGTQSGSLSGSNSANISGHNAIDIRVYIRITNGNGKQTTVSKTTTLNETINNNNIPNYNFSF